MAMLTLRISDELNDRIAALAERSGRTKTYFVKKLIVDAIEDLEDEIWAEAAAKEYLAGVAKGEDPEWVDFHSFMKELDARDLETTNSKTTKKKPSKVSKQSAKDGPNKNGPTKRRSAA